MPTDQQTGPTFSRKMEMRAAASLGRGSELRHSELRSSNEIWPMYCSGPSFLKVLKLQQFRPRILRLQERALCARASVECLWVGGWVGGWKVPWV